MTNNEKVILFREKFKAFASTLIILGFIGDTGMMFFHAIQGGNRELMYTSIAGLGTGVTMVLAHYFGDSKRSSFRSFKPETVNPVSENINKKEL